jgi:hypothetical protein
MKSRIFRILIASLGAFTLTFAASETFAGPRAASYARSTSTHWVPHRLAAHTFRHHRRPQAAIVWPNDDGSFYGPIVETIMEGAPPSTGSGAVYYIKTNDVPWDWAHRYSSTVAPSPVSYRATAHSFRHRHIPREAFVWPSDDGLAAPAVETAIEGAPPTSGDVRYTNTDEIPWDWAHRYPPAVAPSDRPYVSSCPAETVTVPGHGGRGQTVNVIRCY